MSHLGVSGAGVRFAMHKELDQAGTNPTDWHPLGDAGIVLAWLLPRRNALLAAGRQVCEELGGSYLRREGQQGGGAFTQLAD